MTPPGVQDWSYSTMAGGWVSSEHAGHEGLRRWGIYVTLKGIVLLEQELMSAEGSADPYLYRLKRAFDALYWHEFHHFKVDLAVGTLELAARLPIYARRPGRGSDRYLLEEALCNAYALEKAEPPTAWLAGFNDGQPAGYSDARQWRGVLSGEASPSVYVGRERRRMFSG